MLFKFKKDKPTLRHVYLFVLLVVFFMIIGFIFLPFKDELELKKDFLLKPIFNFRVKLAEFRESIFNVTDLKFENNALREEISILKTKLLSSKNLTEENEFLKNQLKVKMNESERLVLAYVSYPDQNPFTEKVVLNVGSATGVKVGDLAIVANVLVGKIIEVSLHTSILELVNNHDTVYPVIIKGKEETKGIMSGKMSDNLLVVNNILKNFEINAGDAVVLSTDRNYFTNSELLIGAVQQVNNQDNEIYQEVTVVPALDLSQLKRVFIIT